MNDHGREFLAALILLFRHSRESGNPGRLLLPVTGLDARLRGHDGLYGLPLKLAFPTSDGMRSTIVRVAALLVIMLAVAARAAAAETDNGRPAPGATPVTSARPPTCGNGILDPEETCDTCPDDCVPAACEASASRHRFAVDFTPVLGVPINAATLRLGYRSKRVTLPGSGGDLATRARLRPAEPGTTITPNHLGYATRVVVVSAGGLSGRIFEIELDGCKGAPAPGGDDVNCVVEACASSGGPARGCSCRIAMVDYGR
jgi:hypothetical protein